MFNSSSGEVKLHYSQIWPMLIGEIQKEKDDIGWPFFGKEALRIHVIPDFMENDQNIHQLNHLGEKSTDC